MVPGVTCLILGDPTEFDFGMDGNNAIITAGIWLTLFGLIFVIVGLIIMVPRQRARIREAIAEESMKYSSRSPRSCSWRFDVRPCDTPSYYVSVITLSESSYFLKNTS